MRFFKHDFHSSLFPIPNLHWASDCMSSLMEEKGLHERKLFLKPVSTSSPSQQRIGIYSISFFACILYHIPDILSLGSSPSFITTPSSLRIVPSLLAPKFSQASTTEEIQTFPIANTLLSRGICVYSFYSCMTSSQLLKSAFCLPLSYDLCWFKQDD